jgi:hypothetical protein
VSEEDASPVGYFSPAPGLFVDRTEKTTKISGKMELFGPEATAARAGSVRYSINKTWTATFPEGYSIACNISVIYRAPETEEGDFAQIEAIKISGPSHVNAWDRSMTLNANESEAFTWTAAHEFGHVIGLGDRYSEGIMSKLRGTFGGTRSTTVDPRYQANLMAIHGGTLEAQNLKDLAAENQPSAYWFNDDNAVRDWVNHHAIADVAGLSTTSKLKMIKTVMGGWVSAADITVISRICSTVTSKAESDAIQKGVDLLDFTDLGQRTRVRVAFANMRRRAG